MIAREEYLNSLELIDQYHQQLNPRGDIIDSPSNKTTIANWLEENNVPTRIQSVLTGNGGRHETSFRYIEDITEIEWRKHYLGSRNNYKAFTNLRRITLNNNILNK